MPELPEVETIRRGITPHVLGHVIERVLVRERRLRWPVAADFESSLSGRTVLAVDRRAKYLLLDLGQTRLILHLGMSGRLFVLPWSQPVLKHDHLDLYLSGDVLLRLHDPRRFGAALLWPKTVAGHPLLDALGPEPLSTAFDGDHLYARSRDRRAAVKSWLMDGRVVVGVGNIYAAEALFRAGIRPGRAAGRLTRAQCAQLAASVRDVLNEAVAQGGTTLRDFAGADGAPGYFQQTLSVYGREGRPCRVCRSPIKRAVIGQRASCYCPSCQR